MNPEALRKFFEGQLIPYHLHPVIRQMVFVCEASQETVEWAKHNHMMAGPFSKIDKELRALEEMVPR